MLPSAESAADFLLSMLRVADEELFKLFVDCLVRAGDDGAAVCAIEASLLFRLRWRQRCPTRCSRGANSAAPRRMHAADCAACHAGVARRTIGTRGTRRGHSGWAAMHFTAIRRELSEAIIARFNESGCVRGGPLEYRPPFTRRVRALLRAGSIESSPGERALELASLAFMQRVFAQACACADRAAILTLTRGARACAAQPSLQFFYTNDLWVVVDVLLRKISSVAPQDRVCCALQQQQQRQQRLQQPGAGADSACVLSGWSAISAGSSRWSALTSSRPASTSARRRWRASGAPAAARAALRRRALIATALLRSTLADAPIGSGARVAATRLREILEAV
jgi:hypothetical protein